MRDFMRPPFCIWILFCGLVSCADRAPAGGGSIAAQPRDSAPDGVRSLAGTWQFQLDPKDRGRQEKWFQQELPERCKLPGSTDENGFGTRNLRKPNYDYLSRIVEYVGPAWYQREVEVPAAWQGQRITLFLERCHWETRVWVDGHPEGMEDSLCVPHVYKNLFPPGTVGAWLAPGKHRLTIRVDNSLKYDMGGAAHSTSEQTQTNWNGIVGRIELQVGSPVWIDDFQVYPDVDKHVARVRLTIANAVGPALPADKTPGKETAGESGPTSSPSSAPEKPIAGTVQLVVTKEAGGGPLAAGKAEFSLTEARKQVEVELPFSGEMPLWDEFSPALCRLDISLQATAGDRTVADRHTTTFGMRRLGVAENKQFTLNGRRIHLRGTLECCIFPLTGYPPTDVESWLRILRIAKSYGLNHLRFHSWCPPEAAFVAADQMGFLFHVEAPQWVGNAGQVPDRDRFIEEEVRRILDTYGNHPSFGLFCLGNELSGDTSFLQKVLKDCKHRDSRHLYTPSTAWSFGPEDEYRVMVVRGLRGPGTDHDFRAEIAKQKVPVVSHEIGQWTVYPNLEEIKKYTGVLRPRNFELVRDDLARRGMIGQAADFTRATGLLMVLLYKEEIEVLLRTPNHAGFQLLDLHDFPGQGTALVGTLDPFWDSKGLITPEGFRRFCGPTVPLLRMKKRTYTTDEVFAAEAEIAHFGPAAIAGAAPVWTVKDQEGRQVAGGRWAPRDISTGALSPLGKIEMPLGRIAAPTKLTVTVAIQGTDFGNDWDIWVYPANTDPAVGKDVLVARSWNEETIAALASGRKVLLLVPRARLAKSIPGSFTPVFWSPIWFRNGAGTMSILCDPKHPALAQFPTEMHTNWQWYDLLQRSCSMILDDAPAGFRPIVQVIDNFSRNHRLGNLFEARVGEGRLVVSSIDLWSDLEKRPAARQLLHSILAYMDSDAFRPKQALSGDTLSLLLKPAKPPAVQTLGAKVVKVDSQEWDNPAEAAIDGDPNTCWHTQWRTATPPHPHEIQIDLQRVVELKGFRYLPRQDMTNGRIARYEFFVSSDGKDWGAAAARGTFPNDNQQREVLLKKPQAARFIRLVALSEVSGHPFASVAELDVIPARPLEEDK
jgi:hypothetical protein